MTDTYDYSADLPQAGDNILASLTNLARDARGLKMEAEALAAASAEKLQLYNDIITRQLPELMQEAGQNKCQTQDGFDLEVKEVLRASIPVERKNEAHEWLRGHDLGSIIKNVVSAQFGRGEEAKAKAAIKALADLGAPVETKEAVHASTLQATLRELLGEGKEFPLDLFGAFVQKEVAIKEPKVKKASKK
ncbi:MAG: hypothetical protein JWN75_1243 [Candidatus Saccharibacteria bacterium]|nr:hypothetical protein [Candidatus Saccharibacteria bacterium]